MIREVLQLMDELKTDAGLPAKAVCAAVKLPYPSYCRWLVRLRLSLPLVQAAGPKKVAPFDIQELQQDIHSLDHRKKQSYGSPMIYEKYMPSLSQRAIGELIRQARIEQNRQTRMNLIRIEWRVPNLAWSMDGCELAHENIQDSEKAYFQLTTDLASRFKFDPIGGGSVPCGEELSGHIARMFDLHGCPLFAKRDNGSNQNHAAVNEVFSEYMVIPLNSPAVYPPYNGAVEESQKELKEGLRQKLALGKCPAGQIEDKAQAVLNELNHRPRPCLNGRNSCQVFFDLRRRKKFTKRDRRAIYDWLKETEDYILLSMENSDYKPSKGAAWRMAVQAWLQMKGYITVKLNDKVSPCFFAKNYHN